MTGKTAPLGICDLCGDEIPDPYTSKGKPRRYCSVACKNTGNSREGNKSRIRKQNERIAKGLWQNPMTIRPPTSFEQSARARRGRLREVVAGTWRNPGLTPAARAKNSEPHKHSGALAEAIEALKHGKMTDLTPEQADAYRAYAREKNAKRWASMSEQEREARRRYQREWKRQKRQKS